MNTSVVDTENRARICRITCGWKKSELPIDAVRRYWRDVHSPSIARRAGIWEYRHFQFDAVREALPAIDGVVQACPANEQLMWLSDVRYADEAALALFSRSPEGEVRDNLLGDIDLIVDQSTTYKAVDDMARTLVDQSAMVPPQGAPPAPAFGLFFRSRSPEPEFRAFLTQLAAAWAAPGVVRLRLSLFEAPDMEAERASGYPIKTHPAERQYQAWIDLAVEYESVLRSLPLDGIAAHVREIHAYPVAGNYTSNYAGKPTFVGLRGFPAWDALTAIGGYNQAQPAIMEWMYGPVASGVTLEPVTR